MHNVAHACNLVGVFESLEKAERAREELIRAGFPRDDVHIRSGAGTTQPAEEPGFWDSIKELFGAQDTYTYEEAGRRGHYILAVSTSEDPAEIDRATEILGRFNPIDIDESCGQTAGMAAGQTLREGETRIPVIEEQMSIGKRQQMAGGVRLYSHVTETPVEEDVALREERVRVERRPADRPAGPEAFREGVIEATETREVPVVSKEARVVEEVALNKDVKQRKETVRGKVRRQDVDVERLEADEARRTDRPADQP